MKLSNKYQRLPLADITVDRESRQRRVINTEGLRESIARRGVINPIIVTRDHVLVAGERRLAASAELGLSDIPVRFVDELSDEEAQLLELEENTRRSDLPWRDNVAAVGRIHEIYSSRPEWNTTKTAEEIGIDYSTVRKILRVHRDLDSPKIVGASSWNGAYNVLLRIDERAIGDEVSGLISAGKSLFAPKPILPVVVVVDGAPVPPDPEPPVVVAPPESILNEDFLRWAPTYAGEPFSLVHCDFPYGIGLDSVQMHERGVKLGYDDKPEAYWALLECLCGNLDRLMSWSSHLMFWFSMSHYHTTLEYFREFAPSLVVNPFPLVWHKSDGAGILPDMKRGPRRTYETALMAYRGDRNVITPVFNSYAAPTDKAHHPSTKPEPVLRHFFRMFVDENTRVLDPTCGGGSALRAAESMGAASVLGLEVDPEYFANATSALRQFRSLRRVSV